MTYQVLPHTNYPTLISIDRTNMAIHYFIVAIYAVFWLLTVWAFAMVALSDPAYVPKS